MASKQEHWYKQSFGDFLFVEKVEQTEVDDKAVDADDLISRVLEPCKLQQLLRLCLQRPSLWISTVESHDGHFPESNSDCTSQT